MEMAVRQALIALAPVVIRHGSPLAHPAIAAALGLLLVEQHRKSLRTDPRALQDALRITQVALEDGVVGAVEGLAPGGVG